MQKPNSIMFSDFNVHILEDNSTFFHIEIADKTSFYESLFDYFFDDNKLLQIAENKSHIKFYPNQKNYITLYHHLLKYIDDFNEAKTFDEISMGLLEVLSDEYLVENTAEGKYAVRFDKLGKIGEHIFSVLLSEYFHFDCIIPKVHLTTNTNMNVYGIDVLFYSSQDSMLLFGESKFSKSLDNGINLIQASLKDYENQLKKEYVLILSNRILKSQLNYFTEIFGNVAERSIDIEKFIDNAKVTKIGIPIFIAHGYDNEPTKILEKLSKIKRHQFFGLNTVYYAISLPVLSKDKAVAVFTNKIKEKLEGYKNGSDVI